MNVIVRFQDMVGRTIADVREVPSPDNALAVQFTDGAVAVIAANVSYNDAGLADPGGMYLVSESEVAKINEIRDWLAAN